MWIHDFYIYYRLHSYVHVDIDVSIYFFVKVENHVHIMCRKCYCLYSSKLSCCSDPPQACELLFFVPQIFLFQNKRQIQFLLIDFIMLLFCQYGLGQHIFSSILIKLLSKASRPKITGEVWMRLLFAICDKPLPAFSLLTDFCLFFFFSPRHWRSFSLKRFQKHVDNYFDNAPALLGSCLPWSRNENHGCPNLDFDASFVPNYFWRDWSKDRHNREWRRQLGSQLCSRRIICFEAVD